MVPPALLALPEQRGRLGLLALRVDRQEQRALRERQVPQGLRAPLEPPVQLDLQELQGPPV